MGTINFNHEDWALTLITKALEPRNLFWDPEDEWEVHGPHPEMNYQVFVGYAYTDKSLDDQGKILVVISPRAVYQIDSFEDWYKPSRQDRIIKGQEW